jgi:hypothetical protein
MDFKIALIKLDQRESTASSVQKILTEYGCYIKVRLGLHDVGTNSCSPNGLIILELIIEDNILDEFLKKLNSIDGVIAKKTII